MNAPVVSRWLRFVVGAVTVGVLLVFGWPAGWTARAAPLGLTVPWPVVNSSQPQIVASAGPAGLDHIQHFVLIMQENRSFDSYFGTYPGADGLPANVCLPGSFGGPCVASYHDPNAVNFGGPHDLANDIADVDQGRMDGFVAQSLGASGKQRIEACHSKVVVCKPGTDPGDVMGWHDQREIPNYWNYAHLYVLQDHLFSSVGSFTLPNRLYGLAAQSDGYLSHGQIQPTSFDYPTITDELSKYQIDWKYYVTTGNKPDPINGYVIGTGAPHEPKPDEFSYFNPLPAFESYRDDPQQRERVVDTAQFYADALSGHLPAVSWVAPSEPVSEHPPYSVQVGMAYVTGLVNAVMEGPDWSTTAIFIGYDESGGFYDHVLPPEVGGERLGFRVPGLVISPYAKPGYVDHDVYTPISWLKLVEERFGLPALTTRDANALDMTDAFDFTQDPRPPVILSPTTAGSPYPVEEAPSALP